MAARSSLLLALAACVVAAAQTPADRTASVQGIITNSMTGEPLLRAHISLRLMPTGPQQANTQKRFGALTTAEGKFSITGIDPGRYMVALDKVGYVALLSPSEGQINLVAGEKKEDLKLKLIPTGAITGRVLTADGEPVENAIVSVDFSTGQGSTGHTDEKGQYRIGGLAPGRYRVRATLETLPVPAEIRTDGTKEVHYAATYYPSALLPRDATRAQVSAGSDASGIDIRLVRTPILRVSGTVSGAPAGARSMIQVRTGRSTRSSGMVKPDGTFEIWKLEPGKYTILATANSSSVNLQSSPVEIEITDSNVDHISLTFVPPMDLNGHVEFEQQEARPQKNPNVQQQRAGAPQRAAPPYRIFLNAMDSYVSKTLDVDSADTFKINGLAPAHYQLTLQWGPAYIKSMRIGSTVVDGSILDLTHGTPGDSLTLVISSIMGSISGKVTDDNGPAATGAVYLAKVLPESLTGNSALGLQTAAVKPDGTYQFGLIAPGRYRIAALAEMRLYNEDDEQDISDVVEIHAGDRLTQDLKIRKVQ